MREVRALLADVGHGGKQLARLARIDDGAAVYDLGDLGRCPAQPVEGLDGISSFSTAYRITLANTDRLRAIVVALAARPSCWTEIASRAVRACWGLLTMLTGSEVFSSQLSAAAMAGGRSSVRDAGASAKCRSA